MCGLGSGWRCLEEDEGMGFTCQCAEGYTLLEGECQGERIKECVIVSSHNVMLISLEKRVFWFGVQCVFEYRYIIMLV